MPSGKRALRGVGASEKFLRAEARVKAKSALSKIAVSAAFSWRIFGGVFKNCRNAQASLKRVFKAPLRFF